MLTKMAKVFLLINQKLHYITASLGALQYQFISITINLNFTTFPQSIPLPYILSFKVDNFVHLTLSLKEQFKPYCQSDNRASSVLRTLLRKMSIRHFCQSQPPYLIPQPSDFPLII